MQSRNQDEIKQTYTKQKQDTMQKDSARREGPEKIKTIARMLHKNHKKKVNEQMKRGKGCGREG